MNNSTRKAKPLAAKGRAVPVEGEPILSFVEQNAWAAWLEENHATSPGIWLRITKKGSGATSVSYMEAIETALCFGWIDGKKMTGDDSYWLQRFTPRTAKSIWSKINRGKALALIESGKMTPAGLKEVERAKSDGRWDAAYDSPGKATVPADFQSALDARPQAQAFFSTLDGRNRYAVLFRIHGARMAETRARRIQQFVEMLDRKEKLYP
jgi:uncharacterized protein YdeI (YjbR/CyaY-like superfamily)